MLADLHIHSVYSSYPLYMNNKHKMSKLLKRYPKNAFFEGKLWWVEYLLLDGVCTPEEILIAAKKRGLGAIAITDHNTIIGNLEAQSLSYKYNVLVIPAMEVSTTDGEILAYGIREKIPMHLTAKETVKQIHEQGGVAIAAHPFAPKHKNSDFARLDKNKIPQLSLDGLETFSPIFGKQAEWEKFAVESKLSKIGGSDAHTQSLIGTVWTEFSDNCNSVDKIINAIKKGETDAGGFNKRWLQITRSVIEYSWKNTLGRPLILPQKSRFWQ